MGFLQTLYLINGIGLAARENKEAIIIVVLGEVIQTTETLMYKN